jgi:phosphoribosylformylglycinamidine cyclo-ligase
VRKVFGEEKRALSEHYPELGRTLGEELLRPHRCYYRELKPLLALVKGIAHITGGGLMDNVPRILPPGLMVRLNSRAWTVPPIFRLIEQRGSVNRAEMYRVFNMGVGMVVVCSPDEVTKITKALPEAKVIGEVVKQKGEARVVID